MNLWNADFKQTQSSINRSTTRLEGSNLPEYSSVNAASVASGSEPFGLPSKEASSSFYFFSNKSGTDHYTLGKVTLSK